jgi:hypothetical protein
MVIQLAAAALPQGAIRDSVQREGGAEKESRLRGEEQSEGERRQRGSGYPTARDAAVRSGHGYRYTRQCLALGCRTATGVEWRGIGEEAGVSILGLEAECFYKVCELVVQREYNVRKKMINSTGLQNDQNRKGENKG